MKIPPISNAVTPTGTYFQDNNKLNKIYILFWVFFCNEPSTTKTKIVIPLRLKPFRIQNILYMYMYHTVQTHKMLGPSESINHFLYLQRIV